MKNFVLSWKVFCALGVALGFAADSVRPTKFAGAAEKEAASSKTSAPATHKQETIVQAADPQKGEKLEDFCVDAAGQILALIGPTNANESGILQLGIEAPEAQDSSNPPQPFSTEVRVYGADGQLAEKWSVGFSGQAINTAPDGTILIGGDGHVARFDAHGKKLHEAESPQMTYIRENSEEMRERAKEQLESDRATYGDQLKQFEEQLKILKDNQVEELKKKAEKKKQKPGAKTAPTAVKQRKDRGEQQLEQLIQNSKQQLESLESQTVEQVLEQVLTRAKQTHSIAASGQDVFVSCRAMAGYGFGVWRTNANLEEATEIIKSLSGCCGQMDVQCHGDELYVCENSRHRVVRFDRDGKEVGQFGNRGRDGEGQVFSGCCNPMNLCFNPEGNLYVSESNGTVKQFTPSGEFLGLVGIAKVAAGCKNSCVGVTADDSRLFYIDIQKSQIIVLARNDAVDKE